MNTKHLSADERRAHTVETVIALAAETNPDRITTAAIAERMGVTQGALFRHFPNKAAIWQAVMEWVADRLLQRLERAAEGYEDAAGKLEAMFLTHAGFVAEHPGVPRILFGELQRAEETAAKRAVRGLLARYAERLRGIIEQGQARGEFAAGTDAMAAATLFIGTLQGLVMQSLLAGDAAAIRRAAPGAFTLFHNAIRSR